MSLAMNHFSHHAPSPSHHHSLAHVPHSHHDAHQHSPQGHFSITRVPEPDRPYPLNAVRHSSRDNPYTSSTSFPDQSRYSRLMQSQPERRSNSPYHHMMNVPQVQQAPLPPPHAPMHDPNSRPPAPGVPPYDFPQEYPPPNPGPSDFHHAPPMYRADVNPVPAPAPAQMPTQQTQGHSRPLNNSKRAEQNRKAQRAFRERRDQHVKQLESRSAMLDVALANADEANRRLEDSRILVEQLRAENQALRTALSAYVPQHGHPHSQLMIQTVPIPGLIPPGAGQPIPPTGVVTEAAQQGQTQPPAPALDPSLPSQTQTSTQDSASAQLNSGVDGLALGYPQQHAEGRAIQQPDSSERRSGTPAQGSSPAPAKEAAEAEKPAIDA